MEKDYSLLRPFDLEAAKRGEKLCDFAGCNTYDFLAAEQFVGNDNKISVISTAPYPGHLYLNDRSDFRMAPLAWVEGRPVYKGDVLYKKAEMWKEHVTVTGVKTSGGIDYLIIKCDKTQYSGTEYADNRRSWLTWQKPKTKREGWIEVCQVRHHKSKEDAERNRTVGGQVMFAQWEE